MEFLREFNLLYRRVQDRYGFPDLKEEQLDVILKIISGKDVFCVFPTGFGKSLCYTIPPLVLDEMYDRHHIALVVSPLKGLMLDQVQVLKGKGVKCAAIIGGQTYEDEEYRDIRTGKISILMTSPEAILSKQWRQILTTQIYRENLSLLVYDEAHCISEWGLDFRPQYRRVVEISSIVPTNCLILTATATPKIQQDIMDVLCLTAEKTEVVAVLPNRPNIHIHKIEASEHYESELRWIVDHVLEKEKHSKKIIIYVASIANCHKLYRWAMSELQLHGYIGQIKTLENRIVEMYHAHCDTSTRDRILSDFVKEDGTIRILFSTIAFGMGIQINDVDIVVHWGASKSLLGYWQELGRCARDGRRGLGILYPYPRSLVRLKGSDIEKLAKSKEECLRKNVLGCLLLEGMDKTSIDKFGQWEECDGTCSTVCKCNYCLCCSACKGKCHCPLKVTDIIQAFLKR